MGLILCFLQSCSTEEVLLEREANIKTVTKEEAIQYLKQNPLKTNGTKAEKITAYLNYGAITQEKITNSNQLVTVIPLSNNNIQQSSRVLLLKVNDTLKSAVFTMYPEGEVKTKEFSGRIMINGIDGEFINGFRVKDGFLISQFIQKTPSKQSTRIANKATAVYSTEPIQLDEVIIPPRKKATIQINYIFDWSSAYDNTYPSGMEWDFSESSGGGGGAAAEAEPVVEDPCDQLKIQNSNTTYLGKIQSLEKNTGLKSETGFIENKDGTFKDLINTTNDGLDVPQDVNTIGFNHTHIDDYESGHYDENGNPIINQPIKIFSPKDVMTFIILLTNANRQNISLDSIYGKVISSSNTYTLKFDGVIGDINQSISFNQALDKNYKKAIRKNGLESGFLKFLKENGIKGVSLYKINTDGTAEKKSLDTNSTLTSTPCS